MSGSGCRATIMTGMGASTSTVLAPTVREPVPDTGSRGRAVLVAPLVGVVAAVAVVVAMRSAMPDDAYITLDYARELAERGHWGMVPGLDANAATSPMNVWLLAAGTALTGRPAVAVLLVLALALGATTWWAARLPSRRPMWCALVVAVLYATSPLLVSTVGLETYLGGAALVGVARFARDRRPGATGVLVGLAVLVRPDLAVPAAVIAAVLLGPRRWVPAGAVAVAVALPWHVWAWYRLGGFVPDTLWLKAGEGAWQGYRFATGVGLYWRDYPATTAVSLAVVAAGVVATAVSRRRVPVALTAGAAAHLGAMSALDPAPYTWYYAPAVLLGGAALAVVLAEEVRGRTTGVAVGAVVLGAALVGSVLVVGRPRPDIGPTTINYGSSSQYIGVGADVARIVGTDPVRSQIEIGAIAFGCRCGLHDMFSDTAATDRVVAERSVDAPAWKRRVMAWNVAHRVRRVEPVYRWRLVGTPDLTVIPGRRWVWPVSTPTYGTNAAALERID